MKHTIKNKKNKLLKACNDVKNSISKKTKSMQIEKKISRKSIKNEISNNQDLFNSALNGMVKSIKMSIKKSKNTRKENLRELIRLIEEEEKMDEEIDIISAVSKDKVEEDEKTYQIEYILKSKKKGKKTLYLVKWLGYSQDECTWEPADNGKNGGVPLDMIDEFKNK